MHKRIMVIDDDADHLLICRLIFEKRGYAVFCQLGCKDEAELIRVVSGFKPELIFMDHHMHGLCGSDLTKMLKKHPDYRRIPVIYFSSEASIVRLAEEAGADGYISKPFRVEGLLEIASRYTGQDCP